MRIFVIGLCILLLPSLVRAQSAGDDLGRAHFEAASAYYEQGRYDDSAREFHEAYRLSARGALLENAARAEERALRFDDAIASLEMLLERHPDYPDRLRIEERIVSYRELRTRVRPDAPQEHAPEASSGGGGVSVPGIALLVGGGVVGLTSILLGVASQVIYDDLNTACQAGCPGREGDVSTGEALGVTSTITTFVAIAAIGVGVVLLIVDPGEDPEAARLELTPGPGLAGLALRGRL